MFKEREDYNTPEYKAFSYGVKVRDNFQCQMCPRKGGELNTHHIKRWVDYPHLRYAVSNGITLCKICHEMVTGREEEYEDQFKRIIALKSIRGENVQKRGRPKGVKNSPKPGKFKYVLRNPFNRY